MSKLKKVLSIVLSAAMVIGTVSFLPQSTWEAYADTATVKNINLGTRGFSAPTSTGSDATSWEGSKVYFGLDTSSTIPKVNSDNTIAETPDYTKTTANNLWRVLDASSGLLFADDIIAERRYDDDSNAWDSSELKSWLNGATYKTNSNKFSTLEQGAIATNTDGDMRLLTIDEVKNTAYGFTNDKNENAARAASSWWWLRSPDPGNGYYYAASVFNDGYVFSDSVYYRHGSVRPAFNLNLSSVLFSSASTASKSSFGSVGTDGVSTNTWKLTLKDSSKTVSVTSGKSVSQSDQTITVPYTYTGNDVSQISIMITDKAYTESDASILYYGALNTTLAATGTGTFTLPSGLSDGYKIYMMAEDVNDGNLTDYSSTPVKIVSPTTKINSVAVTDITSPSAGTALDTQAACTTTGVATTAPTVTWKQGETSATGNAGYNTIYTASITLTAAEDYEFASGVTATVNGQTATGVTNNTDGTITISYDFPATAKAKLTSITAPTGITVANGTAYDDIGLPATVAIVTEGNTETTAEVTWDKTNPTSGSYDPAVLTEQSVTLNGAVTCPSNIDQNSVTLNTTITVTISAAGIVDTPAFAPAEGTYNENQSVTLSSSTDGATIYYTTDGTTPTTGSNVYSGPISVTGTAGRSISTTIKAIAVKSGMQNSSVASATYVIELPAPIPSTYAVKVNNGTGDGNYEVGKTVTITADAAPTGKMFDKWVIVSGDVKLADACKPTTTFTMPSNAVEVKATYKTTPTPEPAAPTPRLNLHVKAGATKVTLSWNKVKGADGYYIYGNKCGTNSAKKIKTIKKSDVLTWTQKNLKKGKTYKYKIQAYKKTAKGTKILKTSVMVHEALTGSKYTNAKKVTANFTSATLKKGKTKQIKAKIIKQNTKKKLVSHVDKFRYRTNNSKVATVSKSGKIKAVGKGKCNIYAYANNGVYKKFTITVK